MLLDRETEREATIFTRSKYARLVRDAWRKMS